MRLVLDRRHRSVAVVRSKTKQVVGGITYRTFPEQRFGEIAFCAITSNEQVKGFGTRLMNYTKVVRVCRALDVPSTWCDRSMPSTRTTLNSS